MLIRPVETNDRLPIMKLLLKAFGRTEESRLVDALRGSGIRLIELAAIDEEETVIGHILFSPLKNKSKLMIAGLGPMAVMPEEQRKGIGSILVEKGLDACTSAGYDAVVVIGHPAYYPKFGFTPAGESGISTDFIVPEESLLCKELSPGALDRKIGLVEYHSAFARFV